MGRRSSPAWLSIVKRACGCSMLRPPAVLLGGFHTLALRDQIEAFANLHARLVPLLSSGCQAHVTRRSEAVPSFLAAQCVSVNPRLRFRAAHFEIKSGT